ncbi:hypothetical protein QE152_g1537 [Popillia japonica]|uniref:Uncharacterized protein n=1 Tax=Popillia japonica TaxID=7064 RepID=A0AAW1N3U7_POPJA
MSFFDDLFTRKKEPPKKSSGKKPKEDPPTKRLGHTQKKSTHAAAAISKSNFNLNAAPTSKQHQLKPSKSTPDFGGKPSTSQIRKHENAGRATAKANLPKPHAAHHLDIATTTSTRSSINHNNNVIVHTEDLDPEILRAISLIDDADVTYRRVHGTNKTSEQSGDDLSRSSSITNLNAEGKSSKGASSKIKKSASKDRLDKIADKKNDKKGLTKNNNKIEDTASYSTESLQEIESLQRQLQEMANDKSSLALQLGEQKGHLHLLEGEMLNLKMLHEQLSQENHLLRSRLKDVAHSPLSDNEKQQLLLESHRHHNSAPASIATNIIEDASTGDVTACPTPDWDKHSSGNVSEISVACLQDRINQMEETHYSTKEELQATVQELNDLQRQLTNFASTKEELQATVQELNDLQRQLTELQQDNYQLLEEKNLMFDSLCRQTERLNESKGEIESLKQRLRDKEDDTGQYESAIEHEQKLLALLKDTQEEREILLLKHEQVTGELQEAIAQNSQQVSAIEQLNDRIKTLESTLDAKHAEHKQLEREMVTLKDQSSGMQIEINRLSDLLENARTKILELEQDRALSDKSELDELLDNARKEKDALEAEVTNLKEQVARSKNEAEKLKDQVSVLQEECKVTRNNAKCTQSELEYKCDILTADKNALNEQLLQLQEAANGLQVQAQCQMEDKRQLSAVLSETQKLLSEAERRNQDLENELDDLRKLRKDENEEWEKFQNDLLTSVRVANDFKTEAQQDLQKMILENKAHRDKVRHLEAQIDKLRGKPQQDEEELPLPPPPSPPNTLDIPLREQEVQKQEPEAEYHEIIATPTTSEPPQKPDEIDDVELRQSPKSKARSGASPKSFFKKPKIFRNHKGYYVSGPNSLENPDMQGPDSLDSRADLSLPIIPHQVEVPPEKIEEVTPSAATPGTEIKAKKMFGGLMSGKQKKEEAKLHLSSQEQKDLKMLNELYAAIDPNIPEEFLSAEQKFIVKLKQTYESTLERKKAKPVANKPKSHLAISKPLLTSVISNPKLKQIADDPTVRLVEDDTTKNLYNTSNVFYPISQPMSNSKRFEDIHESTITFNYYDNEDTRRTVESFKPPPSDPNLAKSKSLNDLYFRKDDLNKITNFPYDRQHSMGSLTNFVATTSRPSTMNPIDGIPDEFRRYNIAAIHHESDRSQAGEHSLHLLGRSIASTFSDVSDNSEPNLVGDLAKKRSFYKDENLGETLDELCLQIDPNLSESELTNEQKFVRNMKVSMDEMGRKQSLRKQSKRNAKISEPTKESVWSNPKLASVIKDPNTIEVKPDVPNKENKIRKLLDRFKSKKSEGSPPPPKKVLAKKQISQEDIVHVSLPPAKLEVQKSSAPTTKKGKSSKTLTKHKSETNLIQTKPGGNGGDTLLARHKSETDLAHQHGREDHQIVIDASESTSSLFKSVITNSDLQKLIEGRNVESDRTLHPPPPQKAYENEDNSSFNSDLYVEDTSSLDQPNNLNYSASDSTNSTTSSKKEVIHRISSIPPTESFNTFVKQKISPHTPKTVFDYAELNAEVRTPKPDQEYIEKLLSSNSQQADRDRKSLYIKTHAQTGSGIYREIKQVSTPTRPPPPPPTGPRPKSDLVLEPAQSAVDQNYFNFSFKFEDRAAGTAETAAANYEDVKEEVDSERAVNEEEVAADFSDLNFEFRPTPHNLLPPKNIEEFEVIEPPGMFSNDDVIIPPPPQNDESVQKVEIIEIFSGKIEGLTSPPPPPPLVSFEPDEADIIYSEINYQRFEIMEIIEEISHYLF